MGLSNSNLVTSRLAIGGLALFMLCVSAVFAQREAASRGNYDKVYEGSAKSAAATAVRAKMSLSLQNAIARARRNTAGVGPKRTTPGRTGTSTSSVQTSGIKTNTYFKPDPSLDNMAQLANALGSTSEERGLLRQLFNATKTAFEKEVAGKGRRNNIAAAFTFFIGSAAMVYHDDAEPTDEALDKLWDGLDTFFNESGEFGQLTDREKQEMYDTIVAFSGLILGTYFEGKNTGNAQTLLTARLLAGTLIMVVLKADPEKLRWSKDGLVLS